jgi:hypothetical protein
MGADAASTDAASTTPMNPSVGTTEVAHAETERPNTRLVMRVSMTDTSNRGPFPTKRSRREEELAIKHFVGTRRFRIVEMTRRLSARPRKED